MENAVLFALYCQFIIKPDERWRSTLRFISLLIYVTVAASDTFIKRGWVSGWLGGSGGGGVGISLHTHAHIHKHGTLYIAPSLSLFKLFNQTQISSDRRGNKLAALYWPQGTRLRGGQGEKRRSGRGRNSAAVYRTIYYHTAGIPICLYIYTHTGGIRC